MATSKPEGDVHFEGTEEERESFFRAYEILERRMKVPSGFLRSLLLDSDWSLVIKLHALVEAAIIEAIRDSVDDERLTAIIARLPLNHAKSGKIAFARSLGLLSDDDVEAIRLLSSARNAIVHDVSQVNFSLATYIEQLSPSDRAKWERISVTVRTICEPSGVEVARPSNGLWGRVTLLVAEVTATGLGHAAQRHKEMRPRALSPCSAQQ